MEVIIGSEAIATGKLTRGALRWNYTAIHPDVYIPVGARRDTETRATAAWLWTGRKGVIAGRTAARLMGVTWIEDTAPIELISKPRRPREGVIVRNELIAADEVRTDRWLPITTPARTALDLARRLPHEDAVRHLDAISEVTGISVADVEPLASRCRTARGMATARESLDLMDGGSRSPEETMLRLWLIEGGLPRPQTSIEIGDDHWEAVVGMGWPGSRVGLELAGHRRGLASDVLFRDLLNRLDWRLIEVLLPQHGRSNVVYRARAALRQRG